MRLWVSTLWTDACTSARGYNSLFIVFLQSVSAAHFIENFLQPSKPTFVIPRRAV